MTSDPETVAIAGGGPVGATLALALARSGVASTLVEPGPGGAGDERPIALAASSVRILDSLGAWRDVAPRACPISMVHVSQRGHFGAVRLRAEEQGLDALGQVAPASAIAGALSRAVASCDRVHRVDATRVVGATAGAQAVHLACLPERDTPPAARLLVVADGGSELLTGLGVNRYRRDYEQGAVVCTVRPQREHQGVAYERFTDEGPLALLPLREGRCAVVWTLPEMRARAMAELDDEGFIRALRRAFGGRLGSLDEPGPRSAFPLALVASESLVGDRLVLVGNAAHQLHPVAGQGLNLGMRDAAVLADVIVAASRDGLDPGSPAVLEDYARRRAAEQRAVVRFTDLLARGFDEAPRPLASLRAIAMLALGLLPPLGGLLARHAMGLAGTQPRLVRGAPP